jgi:hypothetical protein
VRSVFMAAKYKRKKEGTFKNLVHRCHNKTLFHLLPKGVYLIRRLISNGQFNFKLVKDEVHL